jgi:hypothetical protein
LAVPGTGAANGRERRTAIKPAQAIAEFVTGFDLKNAPQIVIDRARSASVDTVGVMLAGSQHQPTDIICDMIKLEGSAPAATIVGRICCDVRSLRRSLTASRATPWITI